METCTAGSVISLLVAVNAHALYSTVAILDAPFGANIEFATMYWLGPAQYQLSERNCIDKGMKAALAPLQVFGNSCVTKRRNGWPCILSRL